MNQIENRAKALVKELVPNFSKLEFRASIGNTSHSAEFFVWINGERKQCYELADSGVIDEEKMERLFDSFAEFVRCSNDYKADEVNNVQFSSECDR